MTTHSIPVVPAASILVLKDNKAVIVKRGKAPSRGLWALPGGKQETGETLGQTARRELLEETGLVATNITFLRRLEPVSIDENGVSIRKYELSVFMVDAFKGSLSAGDDAEQAIWVGAHELDQYQYSAGSKALLLEFLSTQCC